MVAIFAFLIQGRKQFSYRLYNVHIKVYGIDFTENSRGILGSLAVSNHLPPNVCPGCDSVKVFSSLVPALLAKNLRLEVWEQNPGSTARWTRRLSASPGNVEAIMADITSGATLVPGLVKEPGAPVSASCCRSLVLAT